MAKIALEVERAVAERRRSGTPGCATGRTIARGDGWAVRDVVCNLGPDDRPFEEEHASLSISMIVAGTFQYRSAAGRELLTPGSLLLGNGGCSFECAHDHAAGDRCIAFQYEPAYFERIVDAKPFFRAVRLPPLRAFSALIARASAAIVDGAPVSWEELAADLAARVLASIRGEVKSPPALPARSVARVTRLVRAIERHSSVPLDIGILARESGLSPYHFLRTFERVAGVTPHQYILRTRLRDAALRLNEPGKILDIALDSGFGDVSNFNRAFRTEFGVSPRAYRRAQFAGVAA